MPTRTSMALSAVLLETGILVLAIGLVRNSAATLPGAILILAGLGSFLAHVRDIVKRKLPPPAALPRPDWATWQTHVAFGWLLLWRLLARRFEAHTVADAAFVAVLMFTTTSRVISPQYLVWLVGVAAVCLCHPSTRMRLPVWLVLAASFVTVLEFPLWFAHVVASDALGVTLLFVRNGLLLTATLLAATRLWRATVRRTAPVPDGVTPADLPSTATAGSAAPRP